MRILFVALKYDYGIPERGLSFEYYNFFDALVAMGHDVDFFDFGTLYRALGSEAMSKRLFSHVEETRPDLMFTFLFADEFDHRILSDITRSERTVTFNWFADDHWRFERFSRHWAPCFHFVSTTDAASVPRYHGSGYRNVLPTQWAANTRLYKPAEMTYRYDVSFVGQGYGERPALVNALADRGVRVATFGTYWNVRRRHWALARLGLLRRQKLERLISSSKVAFDEMIRVFQTTRINLNVSLSSGNGPNQVKGRNFELPACRAFQISGVAERLGEYLEPNKEIVCYRNVDELAALITYYLKHEEERLSIAQAGYLRVLREHTYAHRFSALFKAMHLE